MADARAPSAHRLELADALAGAVVLVADDVEANVRLLDRLLVRAGVEKVIGVTDARQVVDQYQLSDPDLIMLDLHMPHLDGVEVLRRLTEVMPPDSFTPIVVLTADTTPEAMERALAAGAKDFVTKPFERSEVLLRVKNLLETRALHTALKRHNAHLQNEIRRATQAEQTLARQRQQCLDRIHHILDAADINMVFQPIIDLSTSKLIGVEALARFPASPPRPPDQWFAEAADIGLGADLELLAVRAALAQIDLLPDHAYMSVNVSPASATHPDLAAALAPCAHRVVLELTEHAPIDRYDQLIDALGPIRRLGVRIAIDDAGAGYAGLRHILRLQPHIIKLDIDLTRDIHADPARRALAASLVTFAAEIGATITAEGIEHPDELHTLHNLGVAAGQGYHLGRPSSLTPVGLTKPLHQPQQTMPGPGASIPPQ